MTLENTRQIAAGWAGPASPQAHVVLGIDFYEARHVFAVPPAYVRLEDGLISWLVEALPDEVVNRSLHRIALPTSNWVSSDPEYIDRPAHDPNRRERVTVHVAERGRHEAWSAWVDRASSGLQQVGGWELVAAGNDVLTDAVSKRLLTALENPSLRGPTVPAVHMVVAALDVPDDFPPISKRCGPIEDLRELTWSSYKAVYRPATAPLAMIVSQTLIFWEGYDVSEYLAGVADVRRGVGHKQLRGPAFGDETLYLDGMLPDEGINGYTAFWRYANIFCELWLAGAPGRFGPIDIYRYAEVQHRHAREELESGRATASR
jgi:hypothetical protein